jgi:hypothetical protein
MGFLGARRNATPAGASFLEVDKPTECTEGSWLFAIANNNGITGTHSIRMDVGGVQDTAWVPVGNLQSSAVGASNAHLWVYARKIGVGEAGSNAPTSFQFNSIGGNRTFVGAIIAYDELNALDPVEDFLIDPDGGVGGTSVFCPDVTTTEPDQYVIRLGGIRANVRVTPIGGYTERLDFNTLDEEPGSAASFQLFWHEFLRASAGTTAAPFVDQTAPTVVAEHVGASIVLAKPEVIPPETSRLLPDGVAASSGYANASTANIANVHGDPDSQGGTGFTAS